MLAEFLKQSQSPRFGSRCFVLLGVLSGPRRPRPVAILSVRVSVFRQEGRCGYAGRTGAERAAGRNPLGSGLGVSSEASSTGQAPPSGTPPGVAIPSVRVSVFRRPLARAAQVEVPDSAPVAIPSVRVSVFRRELRSRLEHGARHARGRNPLGSGLGVSSILPRSPRSRRCGRVAIPSVRVSVFRR